MSDVVQLDLFSVNNDELPKKGRIALTPSVLNGMYYERSTKKFVSYVQGRRYFEIIPSRCLGDKEWKERTMRERAI